MVEKLTPEEVSKITGEDIEDVRDEQHPERNSLDKKESGSPDLDSARWDNEIEQEDKEGYHLTDVNFEKLTPEDRDLYLRMTSLRKEYRTQGASKEIVEKIDKLAQEIRNVQRGFISNQQSRKDFLAMINNKLAIISMEVQSDLASKK